jgi:hypothetical protein
MLTRFALLIVIGALVAACEVGQPTEPPAGWERDGADRWWRSDAETSGAFRDLSDFAAMGLSDREDGMRPESPAVRNVQRRFLAMYRHHPEIVDSLFAAVAVPLIQREATTGDQTEARDALNRLVSQRMRRHFTEPRPRTGRYESPAVPDSLRLAGVSGTITLQIRIDEEGRPLAIERVEGIHPIMDAIVMRNYAERSWLPAYLGREPVASWVHARIVVAGPEEIAE